MYLHSYQDIHTYRYIHISCMYIYIHTYICTFICKYTYVCKHIYTGKHSGRAAFRSRIDMLKIKLSDDELNKVHILKSLLRGHFTSSLRY